MKTTVCLLKLDFLTDPEVYENMRCLASLGRRLRAEKYRLQEDRIRSLGAGLLLRFVTGLSDEDMAYEPNGKPYFAERPELSFSLSHSGMLAVLAVSSRRCGIDAEEVRTEKESFRFIAQKYFTEEEQKEVYGPKAAGAVGPEFDASAFARIWTKKEAYVKMTGDGLSGLREFGQKACSFYEIDAPEGYAVSLCLSGEEAEDVGVRFVTPEELTETLH